MTSVAEDFAPRLVELVAHIYDEDMPKPHFEDNEKPLVQYLLGQMAAQDPALLAAIEKHNARQLRPPKPKSFWDNAGQVVANVAKTMRSMPRPTIQVTWN